MVARAALIKVAAAAKCIIRKVHHPDAGISALLLISSLQPALSARCRCINLSWNLWQALYSLTGFTLELCAQFISFKLSAIESSPQAYACSSNDALPTFAIRGVVWKLMFAKSHNVTWQLSTEAAIDARQ